MASVIRRIPVSLLAGAAIFAALVLVAIFAPVLGTVDPNRIGVVYRLRPPSGEFWFGTDSLGRDLYSRVVYGSRVSLIVGLTVSILASVMGIATGLVTGLHRWVDFLVMRVVDGMMSVPPILLAIALVALTGANLKNVVIALVIADTPRVVRLMRSVVLAARQEPYVEAAVVSGTRALPILYRHVLPNTFAPMLVQATYIFSSAMIAEAALSFIGAGVPPDVPSWGNIMSEARVLWQLVPSIVFIPAAFLSVAVLAINMIGDGLRDVLDPRLTRSL